jgi:hypothetical protein
MTSVVDFEAVIRHFGPQAVSILHSPKWADTDNKVIQAVNNQSAPDRIEVMRGWLQSYGVFRGITHLQQLPIASAVLQWADSREERGKLTTADDICQAHESLMEFCIAAYGKNRDFKSLASKALWLCYPDDVPLFDSRTQCALCVFSKLEDGIAPRADDASEYRQFVHVWKAFYEKYKDTITSLEMHNYPYPVRVFDVILWIIGSPGYKAVV